MNQSNDIKKRGNTYWIDTYIKPKGGVLKERLKRSLKTKNYKEAIINAKILVDECAEKTVEVIKAERSVTLKILIENYINSRQDARPATHEFYVYMGKSVTKYFGEDMLVSTMSMDKVNAFRFELNQKGKSPDTIHHNLAFLKSIFKFAYGENYTHRDILHSLKVPKQAKKENKFFTKEEVEQVLNSVNEFNYPPTRIGFFTGMRKGEILNMRFPWIDFEAGIIRVPAEYAKGKKPRDVYIDDDTKTYLKELFDKSINKMGYVVSTDGGNTPHSDVRAGFRSVLKAIGREDCNFHTCRKTYSTFYLQENPDDYVGLMDICGWNDLDTAKKYVTATKEYKEQKRKNVANLYNGIKQREVLDKAQ